MSSRISASLRVSRPAVRAEYGLPMGSNGQQQRFGRSEAAVTTKRRESRIRSVGRILRGPRGHSSAGRAPALQAGGHRFDPGWLHSQNPCKQAGFGTSGRAPALAAGVGWKRFGSLPLRAHRSASFRTPRVSSGSHVAHWQRWWCRWPDLSPNAEVAARHEPKSYASPPPKSSGQDRLRHRIRASGESSGPTRGPGRGRKEPRRGCRQSARAACAGRASAILDFVPSVSPQGEAGGDEAARESAAPGKARPRLV